MAAEKPTRVRDLSPCAGLEAEQAIMRRYHGTMLALMPASIATGSLVLALMPPLPLQPRELNAGQSASLEPKGMPMRRPLPFWLFRSAQRDEEAGRGELDVHRCGQPPHPLRQFATARQATGDVLFVAFVEVGGRGRHR